MIIIKKIYEKNTFIETLRNIQKWVFLLVPYVNFFHNQLFFYKPSDKQLSMLYDSLNIFDVTLEESLWYFLISSMICLIILASLEAKLFARLAKKNIQPSTEYFVDEEVKKEKLIIQQMIFSLISSE